MEENKPLVTETEFPESDTDIISGDGTPIIDTSDQNVDTVQKEKNTSKSDAEENTEDSSTTDTEENGAEEDTTTEIVTDPANDPATLESAILMSTYAALNKLAEYVPTEYVNNSEPDIDAEHLNNTEQGLLRVTNLLNGAVDVINDLQTTVAKQASAIDTLNSKMYELDYDNFVDLKASHRTNGSKFSVPANGMVYIVADSQIAYDGSDFYFVINLSGKGVLGSGIQVFSLRNPNKYGASNGSVIVHKGDILSTLTNSTNDQHRVLWYLFVPFK